MGGGHELCCIPTLSSETLRPHLPARLVVFHVPLPAFTALVSGIGVVAVHYLGLVSMLLPG